MILFSGFGYDIRELGEPDKYKIFDMLAIELVDKIGNQKNIYRSRKILANKINHAIAMKNFFILGVYSGSRLVGVSITNINNNKPWIGHFVIDPEYRNTKAFIVLMHYMLNDLYAGLQVEVGDLNTRLFHKMIETVDREFHIARFTRSTKRRLMNIFEKQGAIS